jgi:uncharacterized protein (TIGR00369 family)
MIESSSGLPEGAVEVSIAAFSKFVGPVWRLPDAEDGAIKRFAFRVADKHMNAAGSAHGGMLMTLADMAMSQTSRLASGAKSCATVSLNCEFVGPGRLGDLVEARVRVTRTSRTMVFLSAELASEGRTILVATGLWKIVFES